MIFLRINESNKNHNFHLDSYTIDPILFEKNSKTYNARLDLINF